jgi:hypothetical protein
MFKFIVISKSMDRVANPFVIDIRGTVGSVAPDVVYLIHGAEFANELFVDYEFGHQHIKDNFYWFTTVQEMDEIVYMFLSRLERKVEVITNVKDLNFEGDVFYVEDDRKMYLLNDDKVYHADLRIITLLSQKKVDVSFVLEDNFHGSHAIKIIKKEIGLLDEIYSEKHYIDFLKKKDLIYCVLFLYRDIWKHRNDTKIEYNIDNEYSNPYKNILLVEDYLNNMVYHNIDIDKCDVYGLKYDRLPAKYTFSGFYSTTGRIFCSSDFNLWTPIQNIPKAKRDILYADKDCFFIEFDYKSFEFDLLCQIIGEPVRDDPHTFIYNKLVGLPHIDSRSIGKRINYSFIYGMNEMRLAESIEKEFTNIEPDFKEKFIERLNAESMIPKIKSFEESIKKNIKGNTIINFFGRHIHFKKEFAVLNNYIQSTAADFMNNKFLLVSDMLDNKNKIILQNHDSILIQLDEHSIESTDIFEEIKNMLRAPISGLSGRIDYKYGRDWGSLK